MSAWDWGSPCFPNRRAVWNFPTCWSALWSTFCQRRKLPSCGGEAPSHAPRPACSPIMLKHVSRKPLRIPDADSRCSCPRAAFLLPPPVREEVCSLVLNVRGGLTEQFALVDAGRRREQGRAGSAQQKLETEITYLDVKKTRLAVAAYTQLVLVCRLSDLDGTDILL